MRDSVHGHHGGNPHDDIVVLDEIVFVRADERAPATLPGRVLDAELEPSAVSDVRLVAAYEASVSRKLRPLRRLDDAPEVRIPAVERVSSGVGDLMVWL